MLAKWLVEELGETQAPSNVLVSGSPLDPLSSGEGRYIYTDIAQGRPRYYKEDNEVGNEFWIEWDNVNNPNGWTIVTSGGDPGYISTDDVPYPWLAGFAFFAELGTPILTEIPAPSPISNYYTLPERYLWAKIAVAAGGPKTEADYISLPKNYVWSDIYNAVSGDIAESTVVVSGLSDTQYNGRYVYDGGVNGKPSYRLNTNRRIYWEPDEGWILGDVIIDQFILSASSVSYPWLATGWYSQGTNQFDPTGLVLTPETPNHTDWSENVALGHIAAAYRGDTGNPANLATYIDWPWRYQVASIITAIAAPATFNAVIVSGAGTSSSNGTYQFNEIGGDGKASYLKDGTGNLIAWSAPFWNISDTDLGDDSYRSSSDTEFPWQATGWTVIGGSNPVPTLTPINV